MSRLSQAELERVAAQLVSAGREEAPDASAKAAALDAVLAGQVTPVAPELLEPSSGTGAVALRKWLLYGGGTLLVLGLAWGLWPSAAAPVEPTPLVAPPLLPPPPSPQPPEPPAPTPVAEPVAPPTPPEPVPAPAPAPVAKPAPKPAAPLEDADALAEELALLDEARHLVKENPKGTLQTLAQHARQFPRGSLKQEADLLRVEAHLKLHQRPQAEALAKRLTAAGGLVAERVKRLLDDAPP